MAAPEYDRSPAVEKQLQDWAKKVNTSWLNSKAEEMFGEPEYFEERYSAMISTVNDRHGRHRFEWAHSE